MKPGSPAHRGDSTGRTRKTVSVRITFRRPKLRLHWPRRPQMPRLPKFVHSLVPRRLQLFANRITRAVADSPLGEVFAPAARVVRRYWARTWVRVALVLVTLVLILSDLLGPFQQLLTPKSYALGTSAALLSPTNDLMAAKLKHDTAKGEFDFNQGYKVPSSNTAGSVGTQMIATAYQDPAKGLNISDPVRNVDFTMKPLFPAWQGKQDSNRIVYPLTDGTGWAVYTMHSAGFKEDIILNEATSDERSFSFNLSLGSQYAAKLQKDGSVGIFGNTTLSGNVGTATANDAALLEKARKNAPKDTLLFAIPAPTIFGVNKVRSAATAKYELSGSTLTVHVSGLLRAQYPLTVDPSIYVETAEKFMRGNNESNIQFDTADALIQKGQTTGARINQWSETLAQTTPTWEQGTAVMGGYMYSVGGMSGGGSQTYYTAGSSSFTIPGSVSNVTVRAWGAGGGAGRGDGTAGYAGGDGGGGGYAKATIAVGGCGGSLTVIVGTAGASAASASRGGNGGGYSAVQCSASTVVQAGGGGGGAGTRGSADAGDGGPGGGSSGIAGITGWGTGTAGGGGGAGTTGAGGTAGAVGTGGVAGVAGAANQGGDAGGSVTNCSTSVGTNRGGNGGQGAGGKGGTAGTCSNGGGGGGGRFGGAGGGSTSTSGLGGGGGGGGSDLVSGNNTVEMAATGRTAANNSDPLNNGAGAGGLGGGSTSGAATAGAVVITWTTSAAAISSKVYWAHFNSSTNVVESPNPGSGTCTGWCNNSVYDLPVALKDMSLVGYNGFLYAIGGANSGGTPQTTVYIAKIGANGEPQLWHPSGGTPVYWYQDTSLGTARSKFAAVAYNNRMYLLGGLSAATTVFTGANTVQSASINPTGTLTAFSATGMQALSSDRYGLTAQIYNGYLYVIGGDATFSGSPMTTVEYSKLDTSGNMSAWKTGASLTTGRMTGGGSFSTVWGAYIYVAGGCSAVNGSGYCTTSGIASDVQLASINADGSLDNWDSMLGLDNRYFGQTVIAWQGGLYRVGGCGAQDSSSGTCNDPLADTVYGVINQDGDASTVGSSSPSGSGTCTGTPYNCDEPSASIGNVLNEVAILNGYLYIMGGCTNEACTTVSTGVTYQAIGSDGSLQKPSTCTGSYSDSYCVSSSTLPVALAAGATAVFGGRIYIIGGFNTGTDIYYVSANSDGSLGSWTTNSNIAAVTANPSISTLTYSYAFARANPSSASSSPGNIFIIGGCTDGSVGCSGYSQRVYKCNISTVGAVSGCDTTGQLQIGTIPGSCGTGLGAMVGTVYANYVYLVGGLSPSCTDLKTARYAKIDNSNNIVTVGTGWTEGSNQTAVGRRRGSGFGYNGYLYVVGGYDGSSGVLADIEYSKINVSDGSWGTWHVSSVSINQRWGLSVPVSNGYAYVVGGCTVGPAPGGCDLRTNTIQTFQLYNNDTGAPGGYANSANMYGTNPARLGASSVVSGGYLYVAGGCTSTGDCTNAITTVSYSQIDVYGALGAWSNTTAALPGARVWGKLVAAGGTLYYVGGQDSSAAGQSNIYYGTPSSGDVSSWTNITGANALPAARSKFGATVWNNRIYVVGGNGTGTGCASNVCNTVYVSPQLNAGGAIGSAWSTSSTSFNVARSDLTAVAYANNLYVFGGYDSANYLSDSQYSQLSTSTGAAGSWTYSTSLPRPLADADGFAANGYVYLVGGRSSSGSCNPVTLLAPISANTTIATGNNPTGVGEWYETNKKFTGNRYGAAAAYSNGKIYASGGACASSTAPAVSGTVGTGTTGDVTTHNVGMPGTVVAGDLLLVFFTSDDNTAVTTPSGWTALKTVASGAGGVSGGIYAKIADGSEGGTSVNFATGAVQSSSWHVYRILAANWYGDSSSNFVNSIATANAASSSTTTPNPPALDPSWDTETNLWIAYVAGSSFNSGVTTYPTNYTAGGTAVSSGATTGDASTATATRNLSVSSEDPGTFTMGGTAQTSIAFTVAVRPPLTYNSANEVQQTAVLSQPQIAQYSIMINTDTDVFPTMWLMNGLDNSIGASWQMRYRSMTNPYSAGPDGILGNGDDGTSCSASVMTTWGSETSVGNVTLGKPGTFTARDGTGPPGANTNCAKYYYMFVNIDASQTFGYPEDVNRGPTISDLTLGFTSDPSKRLMHGRTFTGGTQQPDDTPCRQSNNGSDPNYAACPLP